MSYFVAGQLLARGPFYPAQSRYLPVNAMTCDEASHAIHGRHYHCANCGGVASYQGHMVQRPGEVEPSFQCPQQ